MAVSAISPNHRAALDHAAPGRWALALAAARQARANESNLEHCREIDELIENSTRELQARVTTTVRQTYSAKAYRVLATFWLSSAVILVVVGSILILWTLRTPDRTRTTASTVPTSRTPTRAVEVDAATTAATATTSFQPFRVRTISSPKCGAVRLVRRVWSASARPRPSSAFSLSLSRGIPHVFTC